MVIGWVGKIIAKSKHCISCKWFYEFTFQIPPFSWGKMRLVLKKHYNGGFFPHLRIIELRRDFKKNFC